MKKLLLAFLFPGVCLAQIAPPPPASLQEANQGSSKYKYITPYTLQNSVGTNAGIAKTNGYGTDLTIYGTLTADKLVATNFIGSGNGLTNVVLNSPFPSITMSPSNQVYYAGTAPLETRPSTLPHAIRGFRIDFGPATAYYPDALTNYVNTMRDWANNGMQAHGWEWMKLEGCFYVDRNPDGSLRPVNSFTNAVLNLNGVKSWVDYCHSKGYKVELMTDATYLGCGPFCGSYGSWSNDIAQFKAWGVDAIEADSCTELTPDSLDFAHMQFGHWIRNVSPNMVWHCYAGQYDRNDGLIENFWNGTQPTGNGHSLWPWMGVYPNQFGYFDEFGYITNQISVGGNNGWISFLIGKMDHLYNARGYIRPGHYPDCSGIVGGGGAIVTNALQAQLSVYALYHAGVMIWGGIGYPSDAASIYANSLNCFTNQDMLDISDDPLVRSPDLVYANGLGLEVYREGLNDGSVAVLFINRDTNNLYSASIPVAMLGGGFATNQPLRRLDVWSHVYNTISNVLTCPSLIGAGPDWNDRGNPAIALYRVWPTKTLTANTGPYGDIGASKIVSGDLPTELINIDAPDTHLTYGAYSPSPAYTACGISYRNQYNIGSSFAVPSWVTNCTFVMTWFVTNAAGNSFVQNFDCAWLDGSVSRNTRTSSNFTVAIAAPGLVFATNTMDFGSGGTSSFKWIQTHFDAATNTSGNRYLLKVQYQYQ